MKRNLMKKVLSSFIVLLIIVQIVPFNVLALQTDELESSQTRNNCQDISNIAIEVEDERTEFSKTYLLEDGSYCDISTFSPIHKIVNGKWENIDNSLEQEIDTIEEAQSVLRESIIEENNTHVSVASINNFNEETEEITLDDENAFSYNTTACTVENNSIWLIEQEALVAKLNNVKHYHDKNKLVTSAFVNMECETYDNVEITLKEKFYSWTESTSLSWSVLDEEGKDIAVQESGSSGFSWDITDLYSRWDKGVTDNNGFILLTYDSMCELELTSLSVVVTYRDIDETDMDSTYHTVDMSRAGSVYVNDLTNTVKLEQDILKIPRSAMPIDLKRIYNLSDTFDSDTATGLRWNYESKIVLSNGLASWATIDGTVKRFTQSNPEVVSNGYTKWNLASDTESSDTSLWIKSSELSAPQYNYSNFYIESNNIKYLFDSVGRLIKMQIRNDEDNCITFNYSDEKLTSVSYTDADVTSSIVFSYLNNQIRVFFSTFNDISEESSYQELVNIYNISNTNDNTTTVRVVYSDNKTVEYVYNYQRELIGVIDENGNNLTLMYYNTSNSGNRLFSYEKYNYNGEYIDDMYFLDDATHRRIYLTSLFENEEIIQYDVNFRIVSHSDFNGNNMFAAYDDSDNLTSYVVSGDVGVEKLNCNFDSSDIIGTWGGSSNAKSFYTFDHTQSDKLNAVEPDNIGCAKIDLTTKTDYEFNKAVRQIEAGKTYVFGVKVFVESALPSGEVTLSVNDRRYEDEKFEVKFDVCNIGEWQYRLMAFKLDENATVKFSVNLKNQMGTFYIDDAILYEATATSVGDFENITVTPFEVQKNTDGSINKEVITDGVTSMFNEYTYENNKISSVTDMKGVTTYYSYDPDKGFLNAIGNVKDENGNIVNPTELVTGINNLPTYIEQNVTNISTNANVEMTANYIYDVDERITSITSNGVTYNYEYTGDKLTGVSKNNTDIVDYTYTDDKIGSIVYNNGLTVNYVYGTNGLISEVSFLKNNSLFKNYVYTYNSDNIIDNVLETVSNIKTVYTANGFELYSVSDSTTVPLYEYVKNSDESVTETYYPDAVSNKSADLKDKVSVTKTTTKEEKYVDSLTGETTTSSTQTISKVLNWTSETNFDETVYALEKYTVNDYFGRVAEKSTLVNSSNSDQNIKITENYSYKQLSANTTSTLISSHTSKIDVVDSNNNVTNKVNDKRYYEYDEYGNIVFEYKKESSVIIPIAYYEYDEAYQLVGEYLVAKNLSVTYTYDNGGNITSKIYHNSSDIVVNDTTNKVENYGTVTDTVTYTYDVNSNDLLTNFDDTAISYDSFGNPLNYAGKTYKTYATNPGTSNQYSVSGNCEWTGKYLTAFETQENRYTYEYDENGNRIKKTTMNKDDNGNFEIVKEILYIWSNEQLSSFIVRNFSKNSEGAVSVSTAQAELIYDQMGEAVGYIFDDELEWYFVKDLNGSVIGIVDYAGSEIISISYDSWGLPSVCFNVDTSSSLGQLQYLILSLSFTLNPIGYRGYMYDFETGLYFAKDKVYSPEWGRYINCSDFDGDIKSDYSAISANMYAFCNNNPINVFDPYSYVSNIRAEYFSESAVASGLDVEMNKAFLSKVFCGLFANRLVKEFGDWAYNIGYTAYGMDVELIARSLFAHNVAKYNLSEMNAVNASWGDGWTAQNSMNNSVKIYKGDPHHDKYKMIWDAGNLIIQQGTVSS